MEEIINELNEAWGKNNSYSGLLNVVKKHSLEKIGEGSSRMVFKLSDNECLKIAKNKFGISQMKSECEISKNNSDVFAKVFDYDKDYNIWSICELCREATEKDFLEILNVSFSTIEAKIEDFIYGFKEDDYETIDAEFFASEEAIDFMKKLVKAINENNLNDTAYDLEVIENYGVNSNNEIKVVDYGLTEESLSKTIY